MELEFHFSQLYHFLKLSHFNSFSLPIAHMFSSFLSLFSSLLSFFFSFLKHISCSLSWPQTWYVAEDYIHVFQNLNFYLFPYFLVWEVAQGSASLSSVRTKGGLYSEGFICFAIVLSFSSLSYKHFFGIIIFIY